LTAIRIRGWIEDGEFRLTVEDEGPGIPAGEEELIFEKLYRGSGGAAAPGAGLGLAICRAIAQAHAGTISARTRPEGGTQVTLALPLEATSDQGIPPEMHPEMEELPHER
jgi:two-component system sensor histidine kinase KdpD